MPAAIVIIRRRDHLELRMVSGGELLTLSSALADATTNPVMPRAKTTVLAAVLVSPHSP
jgi:hypothetical protein